LRKKQKDKAQKQFVLFLENPFHSTLNKHPLKGEYLGYRSINIAGDFKRAIYKFTIKQEYIFVIIDNHNNLYS